MHIKHINIKANITLVINVLDIFVLYLPDNVDT